VEYVLLQERIAPVRQEGYGKLPVSENSCILNENEINVDPTDGGDSLLSLSLTGAVFASHGRSERILYVIFSATVQ
jgi:hypothetical protein